MKLSIIPKGPWLKLSIIPEGYWLDRPNPLLARIAGGLSDQFHRCCYGDDWHGRMTAATSEPPWLQAVWRWCGIPFISFNMIRTPEFTTFHTKKVVKVGGVWYCDTTYAPPPHLSLRDIVDICEKEMLANTGIPERVFLGLERDKQSKNHAT
jgi:hypothetical protein